MKTHHTKTTPLAKVGAMFLTVLSISTGEPFAAVVQSSAPDSSCGHPDLASATAMLTTVYTVWALHPVHTGNQWKIVLQTTNKNEAIDALQRYIRKDGWAAKVTSESK